VGARGKRQDVSDEIEDLIAVNRAVIDQADAWLADLRRAKALNASIRARSLDARSLTRRRRIARILDRLGALLCAVFVDPGQPLEQADIDAAFVPWCERNP
jgi:hypothetical protein